MGKDDADAIKASMEELTKSAHKLAEEIYKAAQAEQAQTAAPDDHGHNDQSKPADDVVDAEFEEVKDEKK